MTHSLTGLEVGPVTDWFVAHVDGAVAPLQFEQVVGGSSNLTYRVVDATGAGWVLRRPPVNSRLASAHDMAREHRIMDALKPTRVPVPAVHAICDDPSVTGATFYVMELIGGIQMEDAAGGRLVDPPARARAAGDFIDALVELHAVDPDRVGLGDLGKRSGYVSRQIKRWFAQWEQSVDGDRPLVREVHDRLLSSLPPESGTASVVHGDYSFRNCRFHLDGQLAAVLDWEICTLGDPLADLGYVLAAWSDAPGALASLDGFPSAGDAASRYLDASGADGSRLQYYVAFNHWKTACILEGVCARYLAGAMGDDRREEAARYMAMIDAQAEAALRLLAGGH